MRAIVFIHGIVGARLELDGQEIWPPTATEYAGRYERIKELLTPTAVATDIIDRFKIIGSLYKDIYKPILDDLKIIAQQTGSFTEFVHYDWRLDNWTHGTETLASAMRRVAARGATSITLICHSMGGLIGRLMLETGKYKSEGWIQKIERALFVCTPHLGAARPLGLALGIEKKYFGIQAQDLVRLLGDDRYPAGYQCMPDKRQDVLYDISQQGPPIPQDIYLPAVDNKYKLTRRNVVALENLRELLCYESRPPHLPYLVVAGMGHDTDAAFAFNDTTYAKTHQTKSGDGTVVLSSAMPQGMGLGVSMPGEHLDIIKTNDFKDYLYSTLGGKRPPKPMVDGRPGVVVSLQKDFVRPGEGISVLIIPDGSATEINGSLKLSKVILDPLPSLVIYRTEAELSYKGAPITYLASRLAAPSDPGAYRVEFEGSHRSGESGAAILVVG